MLYRRDAGLKGPKTLLAMSAVVAAMRAKGASLGSLTHWLLNALVSGFYPIVAAKSGGKPFAFFACMMLLQFMVVSFYYPETNGLSLEEMQARIAIS